MDNAKCFCEYADNSTMILDRNRRIGGNSRIHGIIIWIELGIYRMMVRVVHKRCGEPT